MPGNGNGGGSGTATGGAAGVGTQGNPALGGRGLDSGLAKSAPQQKGSIRRAIAVIGAAGIRP